MLFPCFSRKYLFINVIFFHEKQVNVHEISYTAVPSTYFSNVFIPRKLELSTTQHKGEKVQIHQKGQTELRHLPTTRQNYRRGPTSLAARSGHTTTQPHLPLCSVKTRGIDQPARAEQRRRKRRGGGNRHPRSPKQINVFGVMGDRDTPSSCLFVSDLPSDITEKVRVRARWQGGVANVLREHVSKAGALGTCWAGSLTDQGLGGENIVDVCSRALCLERERVKFFGSLGRSPVSL